jgi:hypothetical protein
VGLPKKISGCEDDGLQDSAVQYIDVRMVARLIAKPAESHPLLKATVSLPSIY